MQKWEGDVKFSSKEEIKKRIDIWSFAQILEQKSSKKNLSVSPHTDRWNQW